VKTARPSLHYGWVIAGTGVLIVFGSLGLARFGFTMVLPSMKAGLALTDVQAGDLAVANMIGYLAMSLLCGVLVERLGPRAVITASMALVAGGMLIAGLARSYAACLLGLAVAGLGSGGSNVPVMGLASVWFARQRRGLATGIVGTPASASSSPAASCPDLERRRRRWHAWQLFRSSAAAGAAMARAPRRPRGWAPGPWAAGPASRRRRMQ
jgi:MFS family permease